jgi:hypothetical protein
MSLHISIIFIFFFLLHFTYYVQQLLTTREPVWRKHNLTLSLLMSYIYGAPSKARNLTSYIYIYMDEIFTGEFAS